jgi:prepilin-type N-terminal cleavage/methylation domain-containing protein
MNYKNTLFAFTLVEVIVSMTILSIIMVSVMVVFISGSNTANKIDIQRGMQENVKNIVESIAEDIRKNGINDCST